MPNKNFLELPNEHSPLCSSSVFQNNYREEENILLLKMLIFLLQVILTFFQKYLKGILGGKQWVLYSHLFVAFLMVQF